jgi:Cu2+-exporting ATPase
MAAHSGHPYSRALAAGANPARLAFHRVEEKPGMGLEAWTGETRYRLGRAEWVLEVAGTGYEGTVLSRDGRFVEEFRFEDRLREGARQALAALENAGMASEIVSGDREAIVGSIAGELGIGRYTAGATPADKIARVEALRRQGRKVLMVGDGLNDAPALAAAHVSMAPASAADIGRSAADFVFLRESLEALPLAIAIARRAGQLVRQNFALAIGYNMLAVPFAVAGYVTPLAAAVAMSLSRPYWWSPIPCGWGQGREPRRSACLSRNSAPRRRRHELSRLAGAHRPCHGHCRLLRIRLVDEERSVRRSRRRGGAHPRRRGR